MVFSLSALWWRRIKGLCKLLDGRDLLRERQGPVRMGRAMFSECLIQFSVDGWRCVSSLLFTWGQLWWTSLVAQPVKCLPTMMEIRFDPWVGKKEKEMATPSSILAWKIPWMENSGRLQSMGSQKVAHDWATSLYFFQTMVEVMKIKVTSFKRYHAYTIHSVLPTLQQANTNPCLLWRSLDTLIGRKWKRTKGLLDESARGEWKSCLNLNIRKTKIMASGPITLWKLEGETVEIVTDFTYSFIWLQNHRRWWLQSWN